MEPNTYLEKRALKYGLIGALIMLFMFAVLSASLTFVDKPQFCGSCHSMKEVYTTFSLSNHKQFTCGDCHLPQQNFLVKMTAKTKSGISHIYHETLKDYPEPLVVSKDGKKILNDNCLRCHSSTVQNTFMSNGHKSCTDCHRSLVHEEINRGEKAAKGGISFE